ncbi:MAG TPA: hypothetical protein VGK25_03135 [Ignavibacteria bacterium]|jgi:hypothetical protein
MTKSFRPAILLLFFYALGLIISKDVFSDDKINDYTFKFTMSIPSDWDKKDMKETVDKDGISYSFERKDKKITCMVLAFKLTSVKNLDDFIYNMEKDISLNIPQRSGDYIEKDFGTYDMKAGVYKDNNFYENIYFFRTKLPDAPNNYVYLVRFITTSININSDMETQIKTIIDSFKSTAE